MITSARIDNVLKPNGMDWISSLRAPQIALLAQEHGPFQPSLFDERNLLELDSEHFPGERLVVCRNPLLAEERARKRTELLAATEAELATVATAVARKRNPLRSTQAIALRAGRCVDPYHMAKHFALAITDTSFSWQRKQEGIDAERPSAVAKAQRSAHAKNKDATQHADDGLPLHSFHTLMQDLATLTYNITYTALNPKAKIILTTRPTPLQEKTFKLLGVSLPRTQ